jgi:hypothetical protein
MIELRKAVIEDLDVLKYWDKQEHVIASDPNDDWNWEYELTRNPEWREQLIAELDERPIGLHSCAFATRAKKVTMIKKRIIDDGMVPGTRCKRAPDNQ